MYNNIAILKNTEAKMLNFFLDAAAGATDAVAQEGGLMAQLSFPLMLVAMIAVFYFLMIRP